VKLGCSNAFGSTREGEKESPRGGGEEEGGPEHQRTLVTKKGRLCGISKGGEGPAK